MDDKHYQLTSNPSAMQKVEDFKAQLSGGQSASIEMFSGITYTGPVSGRYFGRQSATGKLERVGGYILVDTPGWRVRLDALDIKSWTLAS